MRERDFVVLVDARDRKSHPQGIVGLMIGDSLAIFSDEYDPEIGEMLEAQGLTGLPTLFADVEEFDPPLDEDDFED